jgi:pyruvate formate-lyase activating enzyme-like uncharacterized protein
MKNIIPWRNDSIYIAPLSPACRMCAKGSKIVIFVTGQCSTRCFYCPLSYKKGGTDKIFIDEWELENEQDTNKLIREAENIEATGAGIIHLYTSALKNADHLHDLIAAGLDEVRFHPLPNTWKNMEKSPIKKTIKTIINTNTDVAIEIPTLPKMEREILSLITWAEIQGVRWVNLNELEFSERNCSAFRSRGYEVKNDISAGVKGSEQTAIKIMKIAQKKDLHIGVHYCSVSFKDGVQLKNRIKRRAQHIAKPYDIITKDGTLIKGTIYPVHGTLRHVSIILKETYNVPSHLLFIDTEKKRVELAAWLLQKIAAKLLTKQGYHCFIVEEYPTADRLEVERTPVPSL